MDRRTADVTQPIIPSALRLSPCGLPVTSFQRRHSRCRRALKADQSSKRGTSTTAATLPAAAGGKMVHELVNDSLPPIDIDVPSVRR